MNFDFDANPDPQPWWKIPKIISIWLGYVFELAKWRGGGEV